VQNQNVGADNEAWTQSLEKSMGVGMQGLGLNSKPPQQQQQQQQQQAPTLYTPAVPTTPVSSLPPNPINMNNYQPARAMQQVASHFQQFSLSALAERKMRQFQVQPSEQMVFRGSSIVGPAEAKRLYVQRARVRARREGAAATAPFGGSEAGGRAKRAHRGGAAVSAPLGASAKKSRFLGEATMGASARRRCCAQTRCCCICPFGSERKEELQKRLLLLAQERARRGSSRCLLALSL
jgi:hypothetical protein